jgi:hypothetical protein
MDEQVWVLIQQVAFIVVAIAGGGLLVPVINFVKDAANASGNVARVITVVFSLIVGLAMAIAEGLISGQMEIEQLSAIVLWVLGSSQYWYSRLGGGS